MKRIVVFSTSDIQTLERNVPDNGGYTLKSTGMLERAKSLGFTVYVISTRSKLSDGDAWWFLLADRIYLSSTPSFDSWGCNSPELIAPWLKLYHELKIPLPSKRRDWDDEEFLKNELEGPLPQIFGFHSWLDAREGLRNINIPDTILVTADGFRHYP